MTHALGSVRFRFGTLNIDKNAYNPNAFVEGVRHDDIPFTIYYPGYFVKISRVYLGPFQIWSWDQNPNNSLCFVIVNYGYIHDSSVFPLIVKASDYGSQVLPGGTRLCPRTDFYIKKAYRTLLEAKLRFLQDVLITAQELLFEQFERERNRIQEQTASATSTGEENNSPIQTIDLTEDSPTETTETEATPPTESTDQGIFQETAEPPQANEVEFNRSVPGSRAQSMESLTSENSDESGPTEDEYELTHEAAPSESIHQGFPEIGLVQPHSTLTHQVLSPSNEPESQGRVISQSGTVVTPADTDEQLEFVDADDNDSVSSESTQSGDLGSHHLVKEAPKDHFQSLDSIPFIDEDESLSGSTESLSTSTVDVNEEQSKPSITDTFDSFQFIDDDASEDELNEPEAVDSENGNENYMTPPDYGASSESVSSGFENGERSQTQSNSVGLTRRERSRTAVQNGSENGERSLTVALNPVDLTRTGPRTSPQRSFENGERSQTATSNSMDLTRTDRWMEQRAEIPVVVSREHDDSSELEQQIEATAVENDRWMQDADDVSSIVGPNMEDDDYYRSMDDLSDYHIYDDLEPPGQGQFYISSATLQNQGSQNVDNQFYPSVPNEVSRNLESHTVHLRTQAVQA